MKYRKKPVIIEAVQWTGDKSCLSGTVFADGFVSGGLERIDHALPIRTLEGEMLCSVGDFIIRGVKGEFYPCKPDIFTMTYEPVEEAPGA